jgi:hypothetical protein
MLHDSLNQHLVIGLFEFHKEGASTYTEANNSCDVLASLHLMIFLQLEDFLVCGHLSHICDSQMKVLKLSSYPSVDGQPINHNLFGQVNKKFSWFVIDLISVQLFFNTLYPFSTQFAPSPFAKQVIDEELVDSHQHLYLLR